MSNPPQPTDAAVSPKDALRTSRAHAPDLDWSQIRETVLMLELAAGQVEAAMKDSNSSVDILSQTFTSMAAQLDSIDSALDTLPDTDGSARVKQELHIGMQQINAKVHQAIIAFQFYDKLAQRLAHVCHSLGGLSELVNDRNRLYTPQSWVDLQNEIRSKYTMKEECAMFDAVLSGQSVQVALDAYMTTRMHEVEESGGDIELF